MNAYFTTVDEMMRDESVIDIIYDNLHFVIQTDDVKQNFIIELRNNLRSLKTEQVVIIETDYIDKSYRDLYYHFLSTKLKNYYRNCIRLSFFENEIKSVDDFFNFGKERIQQLFNGFLVVRPIFGAIIGRNALSKRSKKENDMEICSTKIKTSCVGVKLYVDAFPHSSQDGEYMSCAETTIWTMLEYFGNKYSIYKPILPANVIESLDSHAFERMVPSNGLTFEQIARALKKQGLSTRVYFKDNYINNESYKFQEILNCYIESGFPVLLCLENQNGGHAVICVGREKNNKCNCFNNGSKFNGLYNIWNRHNSQLIFIDDNYPCYQKAFFSSPTSYYASNTGFDNMQITHFIVPLHDKIYMSAEIAIDASNYIVEHVINAPTDSCIKTFLTTNRSYREYLFENPDFTNEQKQSYLQIDTPKFVWVSEVSTHSQNVNNKVNAIIILDATGKTQEYRDLSQIIFMQYNGTGFIYNKNNKRIEKCELALPHEFKAFEGNLK